MNSPLSLTPGLSRHIITKRPLVIGAILILLLAILFTPLQELDRSLYDGLSALKPVEQHPAIVLITIDDKSLARLGRWPWPRETHARLLDRLSASKPAAIGFDLLFSDNDAANPASDERFAAAIKRSANVVLAMAPGDPLLGTAAEMLPLPSLALAASKLGHVDLELDDDGVARRSYLYAGWQQSRWPSLGLALAELYRPGLKDANMPLAQGDGWVRQHQQLIGFTGDSGTFAHYAYADVLTGNIDPQQLANKIVLIGVTAPSLGDSYATPLSGSHHNMSGLEVNANMLSNLLLGNHITPLSTTQTAALSAVLVLLAGAALLLSPAVWSLPVMVGIQLLTLVVTALLLFQFQYWFAPVLTSLMVLTLYAVVSLYNTVTANRLIRAQDYRLRHDQITHLPNHHDLKQRINALINADSLSAQRFPVVILNIGKFKGINELLGFHAGNVLLEHAARRISESLSEAQFCGRVAGPEFSIYLGGISSERELKAYCKNLHKQLSEAFSLEDKSFVLPISIGASFYPDDGSHADALFDSAIAAMHRAKERPDRGVCLYSRDIRKHFMERSQLEHDLAHAVERNEIKIYYQPQVQAHDGRICGVEALARWQHPERGLIQPDNFIPIAESTGLIIPIGDWILINACQQAAAWKKAGYGSIRMAVNLSAVQFTQGNLVERVAFALKNAELEPQSLELEVTESCLMQDMSSAVIILQELRDMGIKLSIDDFGTGYSSLSYLKRFPMDRIKIDRAFVSELHSSHDMKEITLAIISMAHSLNMTVIAEGVESLEQQNFLNRNRCEELQGFYFGKPVPQDQLTEMLAKNPSD